MDATAINRIADLGVDSALANRLDTHVPAVIVNGNIQTLEHLLEGRRRFRGAFSTSSLTEFAMYIKANPGGSGFIDPKKCTAQVFLNLGTATMPGHADWTASLALEATAAYAALVRINGQPQQQRQLVEWIEDWAHLLQVQFGDGDEPKPINAALPAIRNLTIQASKEVTHTDKDFGASRSALEQIEAKAAGGIPSHLIFTATPYPGFQLRDFRLRLSVVTGDKPYLTLRIVGAEAIAEDIAREFKSLLLEQIGDSASMVLGMFKP